MTTCKSTRHASAAVYVLGALVSAQCSAVSPESHVESASQSLTSAGTSSLHIFSVRRDRPAVDELVAQAEALGGLLGSVDVKPSDVAALPASPDPFLALPMGDDLRAMYRADHAELTAFRPSLFLDDDAPGVASADSARSKFREIAQKVDELKVLPAAISLDEVRVSEKQFAIGRSDDDALPKPVVNEYRLTAWGRIDGIRDACTRLRLGVHKSGSISFVSVAAPCTRESGEDSVEVSSIPESLKTAQNRFSEQYPDATVIAWDTGYFPFVHGKDDTRQEPYHLVSYVLKTPHGENTVITRRQRLAYSALDPNRPPAPLNGTVNPEANAGHRETE